MTSASTTNSNSNNNSSSRRSKAGRYRGDLPIHARSANYEQRVGFLGGDEIELLLHLYTARLMTRHLLAHCQDPIAYTYAWLPKERLSAPISDDELDRRKRAAYRKTNKILLNCVALGFVQVNSQRRRMSDEKDRVLRLLGSEKSSGNLGPRADILHLSREGLRFVKEYLDVHQESPPIYAYIQAAHSRVAHQLVAAELYVALLAMVKLGSAIELHEFAVELDWRPMVEAIDGPPERGVRRDPIPRSDVVVKLAPAGRPDLVLEVILEVDRGNQRIAMPPPGANQTLFVPAKVDAYHRLAVKLKRDQLNVVFIVPRHANVPPATRAKQLDRMFVEARQRHAQLRVKTLELPEPTPEQFAIAITTLLTKLARRAERSEAEAS